MKLSWKVNIMKIQLKKIKRKTFEVTGIVNQTLFGENKLAIIAVDAEGNSLTVFPEDIRRIDGKIVKSAKWEVVAYMRKK